MNSEKRIISTEHPGVKVLEQAFDDGEFSAELLDAELRDLSVPIGSHGERLDKTLALMVPEFSRSYLQQLIVSNAVQLNTVTLTKASTRVKAGDAVLVELKPTAQSQAFKPEPIALNVIFEDEHLLVINKPAGLVVHPAPGNWSGTLLNGLLARDTQAGILPRAGIVHRLDKNTSGLMVVARTRHTMDQLVCKIADRSVQRHYIALAHHQWKGAKTRHVNLPIGRDPKNRLRMAVVDLERQTGKLAVTDISLLQSDADHCLVLCRLQTGRTHQIRVHMAAIGHSLVADDVYGGSHSGGMQRQALHAFQLKFEHPQTGAWLEFNCPLPEDLQNAIANVGLSYNPV